LVNLDVQGLATTSLVDVLFETLVSPSYILSTIYKFN